MTEGKSFELHNDLLNSAHWFLYELDLFGREGRAGFLFFPSRDRYTDFTFHFPDAVVPNLPNPYEVRMYNWTDLTERLGNNLNTCHYIFHMTLGGSTLLCRCLESLDNVVMIKEAMPLSTVHYRKFPLMTEEDDRRWKRDLLGVHRLNGRVFAAGDIAINKPQYIVNSLISPLLSMDHRARGLFMYQPPRLFCASRLRSEGRRSAIRRALAWLQDSLKISNPDCHLMDINALLAINPEAADESVVAAAFWLLNIVWPLSLIRVPHWSSVRFLESELFYQRPLPVLRSVCDFFGISISNPNSTVQKWRANFLIDAKATNRSYSQDRRIEQQQEDLNEYNREIEAAMAYIQSVSNIDDILRLIADHGVTEKPT